MALTKIGTDGVKDDAVTSDKVANAINSAIAANTAKTSLEDESVTLAKLEHGTSSNDGKFLRANNGADPTFETVNTDLVSDTSPQLGGDLDTNTKNIFFGDSSSSSNNRLQFGATDKDLQLYHNGTDSYISEGGTGNLILGTGGSQVHIHNTTNDESLAKFISNGAVELYHDNSKKFETTSTGTAATGYLQQHNLVCVSYSDTRAISLSDADLTTSNFYNHVNFESDNTILDSNGHFVAPVHGVYRLYFRCTTDANSGNRANVRLRKNGNTITEAYNVNGSNHSSSVSSEIVAALNANEYMDIQVNQLYTQSGSQHKQVIFQMLG